MNPPLSRALKQEEDHACCLMNSLSTDVEIGALSLVLIALVAFIGWELLTSNPVRLLLPRWLRRRLRDWEGKWRK